jgi:hypothetical protein
MGATRKVQKPQRDTAEDGLQEDEEEEEEEKEDKEHFHSATLTTSAASLDQRVSCLDRVHPVNDHHLEEKTERPRNRFLVSGAVPLP